LSGPFPALECPATNTEAGRTPQISTAFPDFLCKVCQATLGDDSNIDALVFTGNLTFGPNQFQGKANEAMIKEYRVYFVDIDTGMLGSEALAAVDALGSASDVDESCCNTNMYQVTLSDILLPNNSLPKYLAVVPVENLGEGEELEMVTGTWVELFDLTPETSTSSSTSVVSETMTTVSGTTETTTFTTTTPLKTIVISISMGMNFGTPEAAQAAVNDPQVQAGIEQGIAVSSGIGVENKDMVEATLTLARRRLLGGRSSLTLAERRLTGGGVDVAATITIPPDAPDTINADAVANTVQTTDAASMTAALNEAISEVADATYTVDVTSLTVAVVEITHTVTGTTTTVPIPTTITTATTSTRTTSTSTTTTTSTLSARAGAAASPAACQAEPSALLAIALMALLAQNVRI
jgi:hypothetical protein